MMLWVASNLWNNHVGRHSVVVEKISYSEVLMFQRSWITGLHQAKKITKEDAETIKIGLRTVQNVIKTFRKNKNRECLNIWWNQIGETKNKTTTTELTENTVNSQFSLNLHFPLHLASYRASRSENVGTSSSSFRLMAMTNNFQTH